MIGAGPAGCSAAVQCARLGVAPLLLDSTGVAGGLIANGFVVENYPGLESPVTGQEFAGRIAKHVARFGVGVEKATVKEITGSGGGWVVHTDREEIEAACVIAAPGTVPRDAGIEGEDRLRGRRLFHEVRALLAAIPSPGKVTIIGGGEAAFDYALSCASTGANVRILVRGSAPRARGRLAAMVADDPRVEVRTGVFVASVDEIDADAVLVAVGRRSLPFVERLTDGPGLFICGDARTGSLGQAGIAVGDGLAAAAKAVAMMEGLSRK